jgi:DivIVA domain-containing protein
VEDEPRVAPSEQQTGEEQLAKMEIRPARGRTFLPELTGVQFSSSRRGYDRGEVDQYVERVSRIVVELEAMRSPDAVIERALTDVGEETSSILRRARKAAEEIIAEATDHASARTAQAEAQASQLREDADRYGAGVRAEAEEVLAEARDHAQQTAKLAAADAKRRREEADRYQSQVSAHIEQLAAERHRLIDDLRKLADQFHRTADRALEQIPASDALQERVESADGGVRAQARSA